MTTAEHHEESTRPEACPPDMARFIDFLEARKAETGNPATPR
ncbi:hypothetical protein ACFY0P_29775 [Streptomyces sp. NPDC001714]